MKLGCVAHIKFGPTYRKKKKSRGALSLFAKSRSRVDCLSLSFLTSDSTMATVTFSFSAKTLTLPYNSKIPITNFTSVTNLRFPHSTLTRTRNPIRIRATLDGDFSAKRNSNSSEQRETIMLPGCDYNHWLIVMEFPKDPAPTREQMIDTYLQTLATVLGRFFRFSLSLFHCYVLNWNYVINVEFVCTFFFAGKFICSYCRIFIICLCISMEEAKKNMYAFSTTTYTGFQCTVDEATSEKFKGNVSISNLSYVLLLNGYWFFICCLCL